MSPLKALGCFARDALEDGAEIVLIQKAKLLGGLAHSGTAFQELHGGADLQMIEIRDHTHARVAGKDLFEIDLADAALLCNLLDSKIAVQIFL